MTATESAASTLLSQPLTPGLVYAAERDEDAPLVDALIDRAFGPGRFAKTAERLREGAAPRRDLSVCAWDGVRLAGAVRQWPILIGRRPAIFLGPIAVDLTARSRGVGAGLMQQAIRAATAAGEGLILLVGDMPYFGQFGFEIAKGVTLPGPVDPRRILWKALRPDALDGVEGLAHLRAER